MVLSTEIKGKHTPGPWEVREADGLFAIAHKEGWVLEPNDERQDRADAKLIAAAPEMLEAIQGALLIADLWRPCGDWPEEHWEEANALNVMFSQFDEIARKVV